MTTKIKKGKKMTGYKIITFFLKANTKDNISKEIIRK